MKTDFLAQLPDILHNTQAGTVTSFTLNSNVQTQYNSYFKPVKLDTDSPLSLAHNHITLLTLNFYPLTAID